MNNFWKFVVFCFVGFVAFCIDWAVFNFSYFLTNIFIISVTLGWLISMIFNFSINRNFTFSAKGFCIKEQAIKWIIVYAGAFLARIFVSWIALGVLGESTLNANIAFFAGIIISIPISFLGSLFWAFKKN